MPAMSASSPPARAGIGAIELLAAGYALGMAGTLWDWWEHFVGPGIQSPHLVIDLGGLLVVGVLAFSGQIDYRSRAFTVLYLLVVLVALIALGPTTLRAVAPTSTLTAALNQALSPAAVVPYLPLVLLASWSAGRWLSLDKATWWRMTASLGILVVAAGMLWDVYWHQTHAAEIRASMASLPPHQVMAAGFLIGLVGAAYGAALQVKPRRAVEERR